MGKIELIMRLFTVFILIVLLAALTFILYRYIKSGEAALEHQMKKKIPKADLFCNSDLINSTHGVVYVTHGCGIRGCESKYLLFVEREGKEWVIKNKQILW